MHSVGRMKKLWMLTPTMNILTAEGNNIALY